MPDPFSVFTTLAVPVWLVIALALALFVLLIWAALPLLSKPVASRWPFANPDANALLAAMVILGTLLFLGAVGAAFTVLLHTFRVTETGGAGPNLGAGALIAALLGAPFLIWGTVLKHQTVRYQKEGHMTDRIAKAVEMLGAEKTVKKDGVEETKPNLEVRIGAILSLERIAQDSTTHDKGRDHVRVMEILCAYIRENAPASSAQYHPYGDWEHLKDDPTEDERKEHLTIREERFGQDRNGLVRLWAQSLPTPREDIAQALKVIGRRTHDQLLVEAAWPATPSQSITRHVDTPCPALPDDPGKAALTPEALAAFERELETWTDAVGRYSGYQLDLRHANLQNAKLQKGNFDLAQFNNARMEGADLSGARMEGAVLSWARMEGAVLSAARMEGADLSGARMEGADLSGARMEGADLIEARMEGADLSGARMEGAVLIEARMDSDTSLSAATLRGAALRDVDCSSVPISQEQVNASFGDESVLLPKGRQSPAHWLKWVPPYLSFVPPYLSFDESEVSFLSEWKRWQENPDGFEPAPPPASPETA
ncbi:pentapeptide repeat-containing protein [Pararhodobacter zhoushanensis]|uniref:Pentapeptide repeat-containing protein n=1 Tax=Pararhodobacter zhoushanensis TaxID=2479545 RepID=A0ABT3GZM2_9RHOB|nr:pentapeptide repeat-containing protein [Pararhodobacter zhoushanensis]MCW1932999.1 pentapeptide repeat-containing protein [Pararhodobacter zhoushanensis]